MKELSLTNRHIIVGIGCRRGTAAATIISAVREGLAMAGYGLDDVRCLASADVKADEAGLLEAARVLELPLSIISSAEIISKASAFNHSEFVNQKVGLPGVSEPAALLAGRSTQLLLPKTIIHGLTIAIARENSM